MRGGHFVFPCPSAVKLRRWWNGRKGSRGGRKSEREGERDRETDLEGDKREQEIACEYK